MKPPVCAATKYGATDEIAEAVADVLAANGLEVTVIPAEQVGAVEEFDAVVWAARCTWASGSNPPANWQTAPPAWPPGRPGCFPAVRSAYRPSLPAIPWTSPRSWQPPGPRPPHLAGKLARKHLSFPDRAMASAMRPGGRPPQLGADQGMGGQHRRHPAYLMPAAPASGQTRTIAPVGCCNSP
jgi:hypothetical protein